MTARRCYVGLAATLHDPALAVLSPSGEVIFAEAAERSLGDKRAFNCPPDHLLRAARVVREHCDPDAEIVLAVGWSRGLLDRLRWLALCETAPLRAVLGTIPPMVGARLDPLTQPIADGRSLLGAMASSVAQAGLNLRWRGVAAADTPIRRYDHHRAHAAFACFGSPFPRALCAVVDAFGEWTSTSCFHLDGPRLARLGPRAPWRATRRASLGSFYALVCALCGFDPILGEEWKVMGLAPYGQVDPALRASMRTLLRVDGLEVLRGCGRAEYARRVEDLMCRARAADRPVQEAADLARTGQEVFADVMRELLVNLHRVGGEETLVLGGGCALNSSWNGRVLDETPFTALHVPFAPADDGVAIGAALLAWQEDHPGNRPPRVASPFLGSRASAEALGGLVGSRAFPRVRRLSHGGVAEVADLLARGRIVGWMQGRAEFGPRALGHRSILADPRDATTRDRVNRAVKFREDFRPLAPAVLHEHGPAWFEPYEESPYMERTLRFRPEVRARVPAVVHVDGTGRAQSVRADLTPTFHALLTAFHERTGVPLLLNTSFNVMGKPIVHSVEDAVAAFATSALDALMIEDVLVEKELVA